jgi:predicted amidohydrolase
MRVAVLQMCSGTRPEPNLRELDRLAAQAAAQGATYALSPEVTVVFAENREGLANVAGPWEGNAAVAEAAGIARRHKLNLHLGSLAVALPDGRFANRSVLFRPDGSIAATYDKVHLFDATLPGLREYRESATYAGGDKAVVSDAPGFPPCIAPSPRLVRRCSPCPPPSPSPLAKRTGMCCSAPGRSRPAATSSPRPRPARMKTAGRPMAIR